MVYIYGGGFDNGNSHAGGIYNGAKMINIVANVVVVSINYRLGPFELLASSEVGKDGDYNVFLMDQKMALEWVRSNIASFRGNPNQVTVFGQSAGAISIGHHLLSSPNQKLFDRAILQSGSPGFQVNTINDKPTLYKLVSPIISNISQSF